MKTLLISASTLFIGTLVQGQAPMVKVGTGVKASTIYQPKQVNDSLSRIADQRQMNMEQKQQFVNTNMLQYYKAAYEQISNEAIEESLIAVIRDKEEKIDDLNTRIARLQQENYQLRNPEGPAMAQMPLGILQFYFPGFDFTASYEVKAGVLLEAIQKFCSTLPDGKEVYNSVIEPERNIAAGDFTSLYKYRLQMLCMLISKK